MLGLLRKKTNQVLDSFFGRHLPKTPHETKAFAMVLIKELGRARSDHHLRLFGAPHSGRTRLLLKGFELEYQHRSWLVEFLVTETVDQFRENPLIACETVVDPSSGVSCSFELDGMHPTNGYVWEFRKLLFFKAPYVLFLARVNRESGDKTFARLNQLQESLQMCAAKNPGSWKETQVDLLLMPSSKRDRDQVRLASFKNGKVNGFEYL